MIRVTIVILATMLVASPALATACKVDATAPGGRIREVWPPEDGGPTRYGQPRRAPVDGVLCQNGRWTLNGRKATRAEVERHLKLVMTNRLM